MKAYITQAKKKKEGSGGRSASFLVGISYKKGLLIFTNILKGEWGRFCKDSEDELFGSILGEYQSQRKIIFTERQSNSK